MKFDYDVYFRCDCVVPLSTFGFILLATAAVLVGLLKRRSAASRKELASYAFGLCICVFLLTLNIARLFHGGIYLLNEKETDMIQVSGKIEDIIEVGYWAGAKYAQYVTEGNPVNGEEIVINGKKYNLITHGDFSVGEYVVLGVLPRSGFILEIKRLC